MAAFQVDVDTYSGYKADERPTAFRFKDRTFIVRELLDSWYGTDHDYFKLIADDGNIYIIRHDRLADAWELTMMEARQNLRSGSIH